MVALLVVLGVAVIALVGWLVVREPSLPYEDREAPLPLFTSVGPDASGAAPRAPTPAGRRALSTSGGFPVHDRAEEREPPRPQPASRASTPRDDEDRLEAAPAIAASPAPVVRSAAAAAAPVRSVAPAALAAPVVPASSPMPVGAEPSASDTIRFAIPAQGTLQFLPGRLEVVQGKAATPEIRFVRPPDLASGDVQITFGRSEGQPYHHVQLLAPTVSRLHARMDFVERQWWLANLSTTNPVLRNGAELDIDDGAQRLADGDRIEMGEIVFRFRAR